MNRNYNLYDSFLEQISDKFPVLKKNIIFYFVSPVEKASGCFCIPHRMIYDMVLRYGILWKNENGEDCLIPLTSDFLKIWKIEEEDLYLLAEKNTPLLLPVCLLPLNEMLHDFLPQEEKDVLEEEIYVLTNSRGYLGASALLYKNVLPAFSKKMGTDLYILPSSIHEVILLPVQGQKKELLQDMVEEINRKELANEDILSNTVYQYLRKSGKIVQE